MIERLQEAGYQAYLVGGSVRDLLLGHDPKDFDIATSAEPDEIAAEFKNCRLIGRRFRLAHIYYGRELIEVATFRGSADELKDEHLSESGRILRDNVFGTLEEDAIRRDFTINALYYDPVKNEVTDYVNGMQDLRQSKLRLIGDIEQRYREDPVRMLRAARFAAKLNFHIDPAEEQLIYTHGRLLGDISPARLFEESRKLFMSGCALTTFEMLRHYHLFEYLYPQAAQALSIKDSEFPLQMVIQGMKNTDSRIAEGKPVTPAFLYAVILWEAVRLLANDIQSSEQISAGTALEQAGAIVTRNQVQHISIPKRFSHPMKEIWKLQPRFSNRRPKSVPRLIAHPRFRAAYDFLLLRAGVGEAEEELADWWTEIQLTHKVPEHVHKKRPNTRPRRKRSQK
ncbi:Poly(A) polymerase [hydrothermal vent metagenome]|uniref:Poly(A) polymerase n=1 Tax=hydrothermal vent metagenome TaxID=652676 RepID=A0A3B0YCK1_9ZZZZ